MRGAVKLESDRFFGRDLLVKDLLLPKLHIRRGHIICRLPFAGAHLESVGKLIELLLRVTKRRPTVIGQLKGDSTVMMSDRSLTKRRPYGNFDVVVHATATEIDQKCHGFTNIFNGLLEVQVMVENLLRYQQVFEPGLAMLSQANAKNIQPDCVLVMQVAQACAVLGSVKQARSVHGHIVRRLDVIAEPLENSLITMYSECGCLDSAEKLFRNASCRSVVSWTTMISCYNQSYCYRKALGVFAQMQESDVEPNVVTMMGVLCSCSQLGCLREGRSVHGFIVRRGTDPDVISMGATLVNFYASFRRFASCFKVFEVIDDKTLALWNSLIAAYAQNGNEEEALRLFIQMRKEGMLPDSFTLASSLSAFGQIGNFVLGTQIHGHITKSGFQQNGFVQNSLIDMYCKCRSAETAYRIFCEIKGKDVVTWNSMIGGFSQNGYYEEAIKLFNCMHYKGLEMDEVTFLSAIQACSHYGSLQKGEMDPSQAYNIWFGEE